MIISSLIMYMQAFQCRFPRLLGPHWHPGTVQDYCHTRQRSRQSFGDTSWDRVAKSWPPEQYQRWLALVADSTEGLIQQQQQQQQRCHSSKTLSEDRPPARRLSHY